MPCCWQNVAFLSRKTSSGRNFFPFDELNGIPILYTLNVALSVTPSLMKDKTAFGSIITKSMTYQGCSSSVTL